MKKLSSIEPRYDAEPASKWLQSHRALGMSPLDYLFSQMQAMYATRWRVDFPDKQSITNWRTTWARDLDNSGLTMKLFMNGIDQCAELYPLPPSINEFLTACRTVTPAEHRDLPRIGRARTDEEKAVGQRHINAMLAMLAEKEKEKKRRRDEG